MSMFKELISREEYPSEPAGQQARADHETEEAW